jgi:hypothetical protein
LNNQIQNQNLVATSMPSTAVQNENYLGQKNNPIPYTIQPLPMQQQANGTQQQAYVVQQSYPMQPHPYPMQAQPYYVQQENFSMQQPYQQQMMMQPQTYPYTTPYTNQNRPMNSYSQQPYSRQQGYQNQQYGYQQQGMGGYAMPTSNGVGRILSGAPGGKGMSTTQAALGGAAAGAGLMYMAGGTYMICLMRHCTSLKSLARSSEVIFSIFSDGMGGMMTSAGDGISDGMHFMGNAAGGFMGGMGDMGDMGGVFGDVGNALGDVGGNMGGFFGDIGGDIGDLF